MLTEVKEEQKDFPAGRHATSFPAAPVQKTAVDQRSPTDPRRHASPEEETGGKAPGQRGGRRGDEGGGGVVASPGRRGRRRE